jgi:hypothetical protein
MKVFELISELESNDVDQKAEVCLAHHSNEIYCKEITLSRCINNLPVVIIGSTITSGKFNPRPVKDSKTEPLPYWAIVYMPESRVLVQKEGYALFCISSSLIHHNYPKPTSENTLQIFKGTCCYLKEHQIIDCLEGEFYPLTPAELKAFLTGQKIEPQATPIPKFNSGDEVWHAIWKEGQKFIKKVKIESRYLIPSNSTYKYLCQNTTHNYDMPERLLYSTADEAWGTE